MVDRSMPGAKAVRSFVLSIARGFSLSIAGGFSRSSGSRYKCMLNCTKWYLNKLLKAKPRKG